MVEQRTFNPIVVSSNLTRSTNHWDMLIADMEGRRDALTSAIELVNQCRPMAERACIIDLSNAPFLASRFIEPFAPQQDDG